MSLGACGGSPICERTLNNEADVKENQSGGVDGIFHHNMCVNE